MSRAPSSSEASKYPPTEFSLKYTKVNFRTSSHNLENINKMRDYFVKQRIFARQVNLLYFALDIQMQQTFMKECECHQMTLPSAHLSSACYEKQTHL